MHQQTPAFADSLNFADFMDDGVAAGACGGSQCFACPFFIQGQASRDGKSCASCPMRLFTLAQRTAGYLAHVAGKVYDRVTGHLVTGEPSDSHPQEELTPDFQLYRPLAHNNQTWVRYWPELLI